MHYKVNNNSIDVLDNHPIHQVGDRIYVEKSQITNKLQNKLNGPLEVQEIVGNSATLLKLNTNHQAKVG